RRGDPPPLMGTRLVGLLAGAHPNANLLRSAHPAASSTSAAAAARPAGESDGIGAPSVSETFWKLAKGLVPALVLRKDRPPATRERFPAPSGERASLPITVKKSWAFDPRAPRSVCWAITVPVVWPNP